MGMGNSRATNGRIVNQASSHLEAVGTGLFDTPRGAEIIGFGRLTQTEHMSGPNKSESTKSLILHTAPKIRESINQRILSRFRGIPKNLESIRKSRRMLSVEPRLSY
jgi:hypothetical protein